MQHWRASSIGKRSFSRYLKNLGQLHFLVVEDGMNAVNSLLGLVRCAPLGFLMQDGNQRSVGDDAEKAFKMADALKGNTWTPPPFFLFKRHITFLLPTLLAPNTTMRDDLCPFLYKNIPNSSSPVNVTSYRCYWVLQKPNMPGVPPYSLPT